DSDMPDLAGKHGLIVGVANKRSISWAVAQAAAAAGARLALTYPSERLEENVRDLAATLDGAVVLPCDVTSDQQIDALTAALDVERRRERVDLLIARHVAGQDHRPVERRGQVADVLFEPLARVGQRQPRARRGRGLRDSPRNRPLVRDADDQAVFSCKDGHSVTADWRLPTGDCRLIYRDRLRPPWPGRFCERLACGCPPPCRGAPPRIGPPPP